MKEEVNEEVFDIINRLSPDELTVLLYHKIIGVPIEEIPGHRWRFKTTVLECHKNLNKINAKRRKNEQQYEKIACLQELFTNGVNGFFMLK